jgi:CheY-like chemotaxis protein
MADGNVPCVILLIQDDVNDVFFFRRALTRLGFDGEIIHQPHPTAAWGWLKSVQDGRVPDLVICDGMWKENGGHDLVMWMRAHPSFRHVPFVIYSAATPPGQVDGIVRSGANLVLQKTANPTELGEALRPALMLMRAECRVWLKRA